MILSRVRVTTEHSGESHEGRRQHGDILAEMGPRLL